MQGGPPIMASPFASPPIKKQRAGHTPQHQQDAISHRRAELLKLAQGTPNGPSASALMQQARSSLAGTATNAGPPMMMGNGPPITNHNKIANANAPPTNIPQLRSTGAALRGGGRPAAPPIAPVLQNSNTNGRIQRGASPQSPKPTVPSFHNGVVSSPRSPNAAAAAAMTAAAVKSPQLSTDDRLNRRLEFAKTTTTIEPSPNTRAKSAPPTRRAPPPPPPPKVKEEPAAKSVSFLSPIKLQSPPPEETTRKQQQPETPELTNHGSILSPITPPANGEGGPQPGGPAGSTPFPRGAVPTTHDKRAALFRDLQEVAETPQPSPELRLQQQLASTTKEKAEALRRVTHLEGKITQLRDDKNVKFLSPILGTKPQPKRFPKSPCPKRLQDAMAMNGDTTKFSVAAAERIPFEFELDGHTFVVRRPHGFAPEESLWYKVGQMNAKVYATQATATNERTIEVACTLPDGSLFGLYDAHFCRHHTVDEGPVEYEGPEETVLGSVSYVDNEGMDQEYSLDELWGAAIEVRALYCKTLMAAVAALQAQPVDTAPTNATKNQKVDAGMVTDPLPAPTKRAAPPPPVEEEGPDVLGSMLYRVVSIPFVLVWFLIKTVFQCLVLATFSSVAVVVASMLYLHLKDDHGASEMGAIENAYKNYHNIA